MRFETKAIRIQTEGSQHREHSTPIFPTSSFTFEDAASMAEIFAGNEKGNIYSRFTNPNCREFELKMAALEKMDDAFSTASGMSSVFAALASHLQQGDHMLSSRAVFGSTYNIIQDTLPKYGIESDWIYPGKSENWEQRIKPNTKLIYVETPSNPGLEIFDLKVLGAFAKSHQLTLIIDNCFATPYLQNPGDFGADLSIHSATKYIDGQGRVLGGVICGEEEKVDTIRSFCRRTGPSLSPFNAWILSKSLETLAVRMDRHCENASHLASFLQEHTAVEWVRYPFLDSHPSADIARSQMKKGGGILTFGIKGGLEKGREFLNSVKMSSLSANLGDTRTIVTHPASTTHSRISEEGRAAVGITDELIRVSVGLEHIDDIVEDLDGALRAAN